MRAAFTFAVAMLAAGCSGLRLEQPLHSGASDWHMFGGSAARTNFVAHAVTPPLVKDWEYDVTGGIGNSSPVVADSLVFVGNLRGELYALNLRTGKRVGWVRLADAIQGAPIIDGNMAVIAASNTRESLAGYSLLEAKVLWKLECGDIEASPLLLGSRVYAGSLEGTLYCVERVTGALLWKFQIPYNTMLKGIRSAPAGEMGLVVFGADDGVVRAVNAETGGVLWTDSTGAAIAAPMTITRGMAIAANVAGNVVAFNAQTGKKVWQFDAGASVYAGASAAGDTIVIGALNGMVVALRVSDGTLLWKTDVGGPVNASALITGNIVYTGTLNKSVIAIDLATGTILWRDTVDGRVKTSPVATGDRIVFATDERLIISFRTAKP